MFRSIATASIAPNNPDTFRSTTYKCINAKRIEGFQPPGITSFDITENADVQWSRQRPRPTAMYVVSNSTTAANSLTDRATHPGTISDCFCWVENEILLYVLHNTLRNALENTDNRQENQMSVCPPACEPKPEDAAQMLILWTILGLGFYMISQSSTLTPPNIEVMNTWKANMPCQGTDTTLYLPSELRAGRYFTSRVIRRFECRVILVHTSKTYLEALSFVLESCLQRAALRYHLIALASSCFLKGRG